MIKNRALRKLSILLILISVFFAGNISASAQETEALGFTISPSVIELYLEDGDEYIGEIGISKEINEPIPVQFIIEEYLPPEDEDRKFTQELKSASNWIELGEKATILEGTEKSKVRFTVKVPEGTKPGTYFTSVMFQPMLPEYYFADLSVHILPYIGSILAINIIDDEMDHSSPEIRDFKYRITQQAKHDFFHTTILNHSDFYKSLQGEIVVLKITDEIIDKIEVDETRVLPKEERDLNVISKEDLPFGAYKAKIVLTDGEEIIEENTTFFVFDTERDLPIAILISATLFAILFATFRMINRYRKHRKKRENG